MKQRKTCVVEPEPELQPQLFALAEPEPDLDPDPT